MAGSGQQGQGDMLPQGAPPGPQPQAAFSQYQLGVPSSVPPTGGPTGPQASYTGGPPQSVPIYYSTSPAMPVPSSNGVTGLTTYGAPGAPGITPSQPGASQGNLSQQGAPYRPRSPPSQQGLAAGASSQPGPGMHQPSQCSVNGMSASVAGAGPQYVTYTSASTAGAPYGSQPIPAPPQRAGTPQGVVPFQTQSPPQAATFPLQVRPPNMQVNMQMQRTSSPPVQMGGAMGQVGQVGGASGQMLATQMPPAIVTGVAGGGQPIKVFTVDQRGVYTSQDSSGGTPSTGPTSSAAIGGVMASGPPQPPSGAPVPFTAIPKPVTLRPTGTTLTYRSPQPLNPGQLTLTLP